MNKRPALHQRFTIQFESGQSAEAVLIAPEDDPVIPVQMFGFTEPRPAIFVSGGASDMSEDDKRLIETMIDRVAQYAQERNAIIIDGGTEAGIMEIIGATRDRHAFGFPLIGVSPIGKVSYPGYKNSGEEATLEDNHTHFVLVDSEEWGDESAVILHLAHTLCGDGALPSVGILVNGGKIALHDVFLGTTSEHKMPFIVLEGSGRAADAISTAFRSGKTTQKIVQAILKGGDIRLVATIEGPDVLQKTLDEIFARKSVK